MPVLVSAVQPFRATDSDLARFVVIGAGVVGVASAYSLCKLGHQVTLVDRNAGPCAGASVRNGAQLSYAYSDALASPALLRHMPGILLGRDPAFQVRLRADPAFWLWGLRFMLNATPQAFRSNTRHLLEMASGTARVLTAVQVEFDLAFDYAVSGKMILYPTAAGFAKAEKGAALKREMGHAQHMLSRDEATRIEPALAHYRDAIAGVVYSPNDAAGRPSLFCEALINRLRDSYGLQTRYSIDAKRIVTRQGRVTAVEFRSSEALACDAVVIATGYSTQLARPFARTYGAIWPVQGYSVTTRALAGAMSVSITDVKRKLVFARLGGQLRVAGIADIGPRDFRFQQARFETFLRGIKASFAQGFDLESGEGLEPWSDARPSTPSSRPIIARGRVAGVYLNLGHGTLGWTLSLGSADRLATLVAADYPKSSA